MLKHKGILGKSTFLLFLIGCFNSFVPAFSQPIVPASDGTGTVVTPKGNQFNITGGQLSRDRANLFHSFEQFNLDAGQVAHFLSNPAIRNILARINGGDVSYINGLISITGGNSNLFLMNPAGFVFGSNASLNVPASFSATTANGIGFNSLWFRSVGANNYATLNGSPNSFAFATAQPGTIFNFGNLAVSGGQNLSFLAGIVVNAGSLSAPGGQITIAAVPGENVVRLSQPGMLLSLDVAAGIQGLEDESPVNPVSLPQLLTGGGSHANQIALNKDGQLELIGSGIRVEPGDVVISNNSFNNNQKLAINSGNALLAADNNLSLVESQLRTTGNLNLIAGNTVTVRDSLTNPFSAVAGRNLYVRGTEAIDILALNHPGMPFQSGGNMTFVTNGVFSGDARFASQGNFSILNEAGDAGKFISFFDPIISANGDVIFGDYTGVALKIEAKGSITGGDITITGPDTDISGTDPDIAILNNSAALILRSDLTTLANSANALGEILEEGTIFNITDEPITNGITINNILTAGGPVIFSGAGAITLGSINTQGGIINVTSSNSTITSAGLLNSSSSSGSGGAITLNAAGNILTSEISARSNATPQIVAETGQPAMGGDITITSIAGNIDTTAGILDASSSAGTGGAITLNAPGNLTTNNIVTNGGNISFSSSAGNINTAAGILNTSSSAGIGGSIALNAAGNLTTAEINTSSETGTGGAIALTAAGSLTGGNLSTKGAGGGNLTIAAGATVKTGNLDTSGSAGNGGNVTINSPADIVAGSINAQGGSAGIGGAVSLTTASFVRSTATFIERNGTDASISTAAGAGGGGVTITHGGGCSSDPNCLPLAPFIVGNASVNGTSGAISTASDNSILPQQSFAGSYTQNNIQIITATPDQPTPTPPPTEPEIPPTDNPNSNLGEEDQNRLSRDIQGNAIELYDSIDRPFLDNIASGLADLEDQGVLRASILRIEIANALDQGLLEDAVLKIEELRTQEFQQYFGENFSTGLAADNSISNLKNKLLTVAEQTGTQPAVVYVFSRPEKLELVLLTPNGELLHKIVPQAQQETLLQSATEFRNEIVNPRKQKTKSYLPSSQQLYQWLIAPLEETLTAQNIDTLLFSTEPGLRSLPVAALHDGSRFLMEKYRLSLVPSLNLTDTRPGSLEATQVLAMGASQFETLGPLPAVPVELATITTKLWPGKSFLNSDFTLENLQSEHAQENFKIIHLATHSEFLPGDPTQSYIQLWNSQLNLLQLRQLNLNSPQVDLLVLSACRTALGDEQAELGFAGLAVQSGVKTAVASLWYVSDLGSLALMLEFYRQLDQVSLKAEALRQAQIAMLNGEIRIENAQLRVPGLASGVPLPAELSKLGDVNLSHPYYWAAFTIVGSPW
ncbi:MAG: CHAT domain-containing protein [Microcoleus vaginatus WJT46-NPBG5]|jgi:filamentous hemagglutinin family protein|nr:CHAT domain-containing protein [Microcoleus vaginatus WJT46-NPBG5]